MWTKQKLPAFDVVAGTLLISLAAVLWSMIQVLSLVQPANFSVDFNEPVQVAATEPEIGETDSKLAAMAGFEQELGEVLSDFASLEPNDYGLYVKHLSSGVASGFGGDQEFITASLYKPFAAVEALKLVDQRELSLAQAVAEDGRTLKACIWDSITVSDNLCGRALLNVTGLANDSGQKLLKSQGYKHTDMRGWYPVSTARDIARLLINIYQGKNLSPASQKLLMDALLSQKVDNRWPAKLLPGSKLAHKTGDVSGYVHDAGIVMNDKAGDYVIVVLSGPDDSGRLLDQRYSRFGQLLKDVNRTILKYAPLVSMPSS